MSHEASISYKIKNVIYHLSERRTMINNHTLGI